MAVLGSPAGTAHAAHAAIVLGGALAVAGLLVRPAADRRSRAQARRLCTAARSGRLVERAATRARREQPAPRPARSELAAWAAAASLAAAAVHAAVGPAHLADSVAAGVFFFAAAVWQAGWAAQVVRRPGALAWQSGAVGSGLLVGVWLVSRSVGVPAGLGGEGREAVGLWDGLATGCELAVLLVCLRGRRARAVR